ncbi:hypothetical protein NQ317_011146 [Molorchus minor]|uniref:Uncharacterized protein n=1 Tax=Molorchus minor TaxID=1323400 RepID=A0ABQ9JEL4_9CUCU|nr:hypothetical protein NQ317_011146 [Molorchus minor]
MAQKIGHPYPCSVVQISGAVGLASFLGYRQEYIFVPTVRRHLEQSPLLERDQLLFRECGDALEELARHKETWIRGTPEPYLGITRQQVTAALNDWAYSTLKEHWRLSRGCRQARDFVTGPDPARPIWILGRSRETLNQLVGILTGHCKLRRHLSLRLRFAIFGSGTLSREGLDSLGWSDVLTFIRRSGTLSERVGRVNRCIQANQQHARASSYVLGKRFKEGQIDIALLQEPWISSTGQVMGLGTSFGKARWATYRLHQASSSMLQATTMEQNRLIDDIKSHSILSMPSGVMPFWTSSNLWSIVAHTLLYFTQQVQSLNEADNLIGRDFVQILWQQICSAKHRESDPLHCGTGTQNMVRRLIIFQAAVTYTTKSFFPNGMNGDETKTPFKEQIVAGSQMDKKLQRKQGLEYTVATQGHEYLCRITLVKRAIKLLIPWPEKEPESTFIGPEPVLGISYNTAKMAVLNWPEGEILR